MNMISANHNYDNGYIGLVNLSLANLPRTLKVDGKQLLLKSEFHISLVCAKKLAPLIDEANAKQIESELVVFFRDFIKDTPLASYATRNIYRLVKRDDRVTLVAMVEVPGIEELFAALEKKYTVALPLQPTHITLYTLQPEAGIGLLSETELIQDSKIVQPLIRI